MKEFGNEDKVKEGWGREGLLKEKLELETSSYEGSEVGSSTSTSNGFGMTMLNIFKSSSLAKKKPKLRLPTLMLVSLLLVSIVSVAGSMLQAEVSPLLSHCTCPTSASSISNKDTLFEEILNLTAWSHLLQLQCILRRIERILIFSLKRTSNFFLTNVVIYYAG